MRVVQIDGTVYAEPSFTKESFDELWDVVTRWHHDKDVNRAIVTIHGVAQGQVTFRFSNVAAVGFTEIEQKEMPVEETETPPWEDEENIPALGMPRE